MSIKHVLFIFSVILLGIVFFFQLPIEIKPSFQGARLTVSFSASGFSPEMVERQISSKIEAGVSSLSGVKNVSSYSYNGYGRVSFEIEKDLSPEFMIFIVNDIIPTLKLPENIYPRVSSYQPDAEENTSILSYRIYGKRHLNDIHHDINKRLIPRLKSVDGVSEVRLTGGSKMECFIHLDENALQQLNVSPEEIYSEINNQFSESFLGSITPQGYRIPVSLNDSELELDKLKALVITKGNQHIRLDQISTISMRYSELSHIARYNGFPSVTLELFRKNTSNILTVIETIKHEVSSFKLKENTHIEIIQDQSLYVKNEFKSLGKRSLWSVLVVLIVLLIFSTNFREPILLFSSIFISLCMTFIWFYLFDLSVNFLTLAGLALSFGMLVDVAILMFEQFKQDDGRTISRKTKDLIPPIIASTLTTFVVMIPFVLLTEKLKQQYVPFSVAIMLSLVSSLITSFFILPALYKRFIKKEQIKTVTKLNTLLKPYISIILRFPKTLIILFIWLIGFPVYLIPNATWESIGLDQYKKEINYIFGGATGLFVNHVYKGESWSWGDETYIGVSVQMPVGSSIQQTNKIIELIERNLLADHKDIHIVSSIGNENARMSIYFDEPESSTPYIVKSKAIAIGANVGAATISVYGYGQGFSNGGGGSMASYSLALKGYNYDQLKQIAEDIKTDLETNKRIADVKIKSKR